MGLDNSQSHFSILRNRHLNKNIQKQPIKSMFMAVIRQFLSHFLHSDLINHTLNVLHRKIRDFVMRHNFDCWLHLPDVANELLIDVGVPFDIAVHNILVVFLEIRDDVEPSRRDVGKTIDGFADEMIATWIPLKKSAFREILIILRAYRCDNCQHCAILPYRFLFELSVISQNCLLGDGIRSIFWWPFEERCGNFFGWWALK